MTGDRSWSLAGRVAQCCGGYAQFFVLLCNFEQNPAVLCAYIIYNYKLVIYYTILYNNYNNPNNMFISDYHNSRIRWPNV